MQNNNSKVNTILLVIVIILLGVGIWLMAGKGEREPRIESDQQVVDGVQEEPQEEKPVVEKPKPEDPTITFLKSLLSKYPHDIPDIRECNANGQKMFVYADAGTGYDGGYQFYSSTGVSLESCGGFTPTGIPEGSLCRTVLPSCTGIYYGTTVDIYNLD